ncbi:sigma-70 family RNA polymerase sigma factor [Thiolapillus brandeum]|uniref:RNA polymerase sigma-70 factor ECF subfamily n=1 Tax=Thiolapillus brandeum TaxID=1076588 RepID=A0A7U6GGS6_9GAMM|nr:sigma-70 family RNA polymerase sigma factor [Thiolapillus brandeum]BAO43362.1 RNA polymerase sigma-70 factor ECF subfamily [Thiolapillus brandeum]
MKTSSISINHPTTRETPAAREARFQAVIGKHMDDLFRYACWLVHDRAVADDLVQETMLRAWKSMDRLQKPEAAKGWLITILRRENARRFERFQPRFSAMPTEALADTHKGYDTSTEAFVLRNAIAELPDDYREPLLLQIIQGYSQKEIAAELGISVAGAGTRLFRARKKLRALVEGDGEQI